MGLFGKARDSKTVALTSDAVAAFGGRRAEVWDEGGSPAHKLDTNSMMARYVSDLSIFLKDQAASEEIKRHKSKDREGKTRADNGKANSTAAKLAKLKAELADMKELAMPIATRRRQLRILKTKVVMHSGIYLQSLLTLASSKKQQIQKM